MLGNITWETRNIRWLSKRIYVSVFFSQETGNENSYQT